MVVDDCAYNLFVIELLLSEIKEVEVELTTALNGQLAVDIVQNTLEGSLSYIFLDLQMPVMDGYQAARALRELQEAGH